MHAMRESDYLQQMTSWTLFQASFCLQIRSEPPGRPLRSKLHAPPGVTWPVKLDRMAQDSSLQSHAVLGHPRVHESKLSELASYPTARPWRIPTLSLEGCKLQETQMVSCPADPEHDQLEVLCLLPRVCMCIVTHL
jgi:hypothetical protein